MRLSESMTALLTSLPQVDVLIEQLGTGHTT